MSKPNVAVCITGYARTFVQQAVYTTVLQSALAKAEPENIFAVIANDGNDSLNGQMSKVSQHSLLQARDHLNSSIWLDYVPPVGGGHLACGLPCGGQFHKLEMCTRLVREIEDIALCTRP